MANVVEGYCRTEEDSCFMIDHESNCLLYSNPCTKTAADRGLHLGCAFSPEQRSKTKKDHKPEGWRQRKQRRKH